MASSLPSDLQDGFNNWLSLDSDARLVGTMGSGFQVKCL